MECSGYADMIERVVQDVVVGRDSVFSSDDPQTRTFGFEVHGPGKTERYFTKLTRSLDGLDPHLRDLMASSAGRAAIASIIQYGSHGHGYGPSRECQECLALEIMES